ncbi:MAG: hypothetical protein ACRBDL_02250 [Alphaproteobacteria bacterium]
MKRNTLRLLAFTGLVAFGAATMTNAIAQTTVTATLDTSSAITATAGNDIDFGTFLIQMVTAETVGGSGDGITLTMDSAGAVTAGSVDETGTQVVEITAGVGVGSVNVQTPAPAALTMTRADGTGTGAFASGGELTLTSVTFETNADVAATIADAGTGTVTTTTGGVDQEVRFYGVITASDNPTDGTHTFPFDVTFSY